MKFTWFKNWIGNWKVFFKEEDSPYRSPIKRVGNSGVTLNKKKDTLSPNFRSSGQRN